MTLDPLLLDVLACPEDKGPLWYVAEEGLLYNPRLRRAYAVRDGIPVMLSDDAGLLAQAEHGPLTALADAGAVVVTGPAAEEGGR